MGGSLWVSLLLSRFYFALKMESETDNWRQGMIILIENRVSIYTPISAY